MHRRGMWVVAALTGLLFLVGLWGSPRSLVAVLTDPWRTLWGSHQRLQARLITVSESTPVREASRRLLKPFGMLRLNRVIDAPDSN